MDTTKASAGWFAGLASRLTAPEETAAPIAPQGTKAGTASNPRYTQVELTETGPKFSSSYMKFHPAFEDFEHQAVEEVLHADAQKASDKAAQRNQQGGGGGGGGAGLSWALELVKAAGRGGSQADAWLLTAAVQAGQLLLSLPRSFAQLGYAAGALVMVGYALCACWAAYVLNCLYCECQQRRQLDVEGTAAQMQGQGQGQGQGQARHYHQVMGELAGPWAQRVSLVAVVVLLVALCALQVIGASSAAYVADATWDKRSWGLLWGALCCCTVLIPSLSNIRVLAALAVTAISYTVLYSVAAAAVAGQAAGAVHLGPAGVAGFLDGVSTVAFGFSGSAVLVDVMHSMREPAQLSRAYWYATIYIIATTLPSAAALYWAAGDGLLGTQNALAVLPPSLPRTLIAYFMCLHQVASFGFFAMPLYMLWEELLDGALGGAGLLKRAALRLPLALLIWLLALAFPFLGSLKALLAVLTTTLVVFLIPCMAYNHAYGSMEAQTDAVTPPKGVPGVDSLSCTTIIRVNWVIVGWMAAVGIILCGWGSIAQLVSEAAEWRVFESCYQCISRS